MIAVYEKEEGVSMFLGCKIPMGKYRKRKQTLSWNAWLLKVCSVRQFKIFTLLYNFFNDWGFENIYESILLLYRVTCQSHHNDSDVLTLLRLIGRDDSVLEIF